MSVCGAVSATAAPPTGQGVDLTLLYARDLGLAVSAPVPVPVAGNVPETRLPPVATQIIAMAQPVDSSELGQIRGGFALPGGVNVNFGFDLATSVAGRTLQQLTLPMTNITSATQVVPVLVTSAGTTSQVSLPVGVGAAPFSVTSLTNDALTSVTTKLASSGISTQLLNQANNRVVQQTRTFDISITGLRSMMTQQARQTLVSRALSVGATLQR